MTARLILGLAAAGCALAQEARIVSPTDRSHHAPGKIEVLAKAPEGATLAVDGQALETEQPFPGVYRAAAELAEGERSITLRWPGGESAVRVSIGAAPVEGYEEFVRHPPAAVECTQCHGLSRRGRFRFQGGCFDCHSKEEFVKPHQHEPHVLQSCGLCHNAHGSTTAKHLVMSKELACKQCHN